MIVMQAITIGIQTDYDSEVWVTLEYFFLAGYTIELSLNITAFGTLFFRDLWNWVDATVVLSSLADVVYNIIHSGGASLVLT